MERYEKGEMGREGKYEKQREGEMLRGILGCPAGFEQKHREKRKEYSVGDKEKQSRG